MQRALAGDESRKGQMILGCPQLKGNFSVVSESMCVPWRQLRPIGAQVGQPMWMGLHSKLMMTIRDSYSYIKRLYKATFS